MWADTVLLAEQGHLQRLLLWGAASLVAGALLLLTVGRPRRSPLLFHFALQTAAWGTVDLLLALVGRRGIAMRDLASATRLDRFLWMNVGLDAGYVAVGVTLALCAWLLGRRLGGIGA
ncbi:MAG TPA: hypothetical protein VHM30_03075, partial [Gemmatimonadaceae bacterium]|nr:hypothetical protein [Gemmatimonadaceae bacterium]